MSVLEQTSCAVYLASLPETEQTHFLSEYTELEIAHEFLYNWQFWARPEQLPPAGEWLVWFLLAGRGAGKTRTANEWAIDWAKHHPKEHLALIGETKADVRDVLVEAGESSILEISPPWFRPNYEPSKRRLTWPNGAFATLYSGDEPDQLRGPQHSAALVDELAKYKYPKATWDNLEFGLRAGDDPKIVVATTPKPISIIKALLADPDTVVTRESTYANIHNLAPGFIKRVVRKYEGTRLGRQELHAEILDDNPDALWERETMIEALRVTKYPPLLRVVVGVDPSGSSLGAECGIIVGGIGNDGDGYIFDDRSLQGSPAKWGSEVVTAYHVHEASRIVAEANYGGEMVESTVRAVDGGAMVAYKAVHASRGKLLRAEPISALYEQGRVHHVGSFPDLEDELCQWVPGDKSPNRLDALVWVLTELMIKDAPKRTVRAMR